jgi:hypothetical protein
MRRSGLLLVVGSLLISCAEVPARRELAPDELYLKGIEYTQGIGIQHDYARG